MSVAEAAQLFAMVGGDREAYARVTPVLDAMTKGHVLLGPSGAGAAMKLAVNAMVAVTNESLAETRALAERFGIARERAYDVLAGGALASPFVLYKRGAFLNPDTEPVAFTTALMRKDISLAQDLAASLGVRLPAAAAASDMLEEALLNGLGDADMASVMSLLDRTASAAAPHHIRRHHGGAMKGMHHVGITVKDLDASIRFYHDVLGLEFSNEPSPWFEGEELGEAVGVPGAALRQVSLLLGDTTLELLEYKSPPSETAAPLKSNNREPRTSLSSSTTSRRRRPSSRRRDRFHSPVNFVDEGVLAGWRWVYFDDPDGYPLELVEVAYYNEQERRAGIAAYLAARSVADAGSP